MVKILREANKTSVAEVAKKYAVSTETIYVWRRKFGAMNVDEAKRLRAPEAENAKLKKLLVERLLDIGHQLKKMVNVPVRRMQVEHAHKRWKLSYRRACTLFSTARSGLRYASRRAVKGALAIACLRKFAAQYPRYGYRFVITFARPEGHAMSHDRAYRLWRSSGLQVPRKRSRRWVAVTRPRPQASSGPNHVWSSTLSSTRQPTESKSSVSPSSTSGRAGVSPSMSREAFALVAWSKCSRSS